jgi:hypothetical protein
VHELSGTYDYLRRWYDPSLQRWPNRDPVGEAGGLNLYGYVRNNSIHWKDPFGLRIIIPPDTKQSDLYNLFDGLSELQNTEVGTDLLGKASAQDTIVGFGDKDTHPYQDEDQIPWILMPSDDPTGIGRSVRNRFPKECPPSDNAAKSMALVLGHELGHALNDESINDDPENIIYTEWPLARELGLDFHRETHDGVPYFTKDGDLRSSFDLYQYINQ